MMSKILEVAMNMKKNKIYLILAIITSLILFTTAAICNQCGATAEEEIAEEEREEEATQVEEEVEEITERGEEKPEELTEEEAIEGGENEEEVTEEAEEGEEETPPTIELQIYSGPTYSGADGVCYYRIEAIVTGNPTVSFSKDNSGGAWGSRKCQINLSSPDETYNLTGTATNSEGTATDSINLTWGCEEGIEDEEEEIVLETPDSVTLTINRKILNPSVIGYIVYPSGINTTTMIIGDSISNTDVQGYFAFDVSSLAGLNITDASLKLKTFITHGDVSFKSGGISLQRCLFMPSLGSEDYGFHPICGYWLNINEEPLVYNRDFLKTMISDSIAEGRLLQFSLEYGDSSSDLDNQIDGREYRKQDITLNIEFSD